MQVTIARQLGLDPSTVSNFFMNARRRSVDKWKDEANGGGGNSGAGNVSLSGFSENSNDSMHSLGEEDPDDDDLCPSPPPSAGSTATVLTVQSHHHAGGQQITLAQIMEDGQVKTSQAVLFTTAGPAAVVQHLQQQPIVELTQSSLDL
jgi:hypothetical protein